jgi:hypothetical protein
MQKEIRNCWLKHNFRLYFLQADEATSPSSASLGSLFNSIISSTNSIGHVSIESTDTFHSGKTSLNTEQKRHCSNRGVSQSENGSSTSESSATVTDQNGASSLRECEPENQPVGREAADATLGAAHLLRGSSHSPTSLTVVNNYTFVGQKTELNVGRMSKLSIDKLKNYADGSLPTNGFSNREEHNNGPLPRRNDYLSLPAPRPITLLHV